MSRPISTPWLIVMLFASLDPSASAYASASRSVSASASTSTRPPLMQSVDLQIPSAPIPVTIASRRHLAYELHVTNFRPFDAVLHRLEVMDADRGRRLAQLDGVQLAAQLVPVGVSVEGDERRTVRAGGRTIVYLWLPLDSDVTSPSRLQHKLEIELMRPSGRARVTVSDAGTQIRSEQPVVLDAPLRGGPWVALYHPMLMGGHRTAIYTLEGRARIPARFATDWVKLADDGTSARGDGQSIANWHGYGTDVLAVADGTIAAAVDDMPEGPKLSDSSGPVALENASGNYVTLDLGGGRYAFYQHLKHGSITVKSGDRVRAGQVIAQLGNSGSSSSGPHLHFHVGDAREELAAEGLPYVFRSFEVVGAYRDIDAPSTGERWQPAPPNAAGKRSMELPHANTVIVFADGRD